MQILPSMPDASEWLSVMGRPVIFEEISERNIIIPSKCSSAAKLCVGLPVPLFNNLAIFDWASTEYGRASNSASSFASGSSWLLILRPPRRSPDRCLFQHEPQKPSQ